MNEINATARLLLILGSINAGLTVLLGAFGAHFLKGRLDQQMLEVYQTGIQYHMFHSVGLFLLALLCLYLPVSGWLKLSALLMFSGIVLFSGSLYLLALSGARWLGIITPLGGIAFILAWIALAVAVLRH